MEVLIGSGSDEGSGNRESGVQEIDVSIEEIVVSRQGVRRARRALIEDIESMGRTLPALVPRPNPERRRSVGVDEWNRRAELVGFETVRPEHVLHVLRGRSG